jgi:hypothetical protein
MWRGLSAAAALALLLTSDTAIAESWALLGARYQGMGGAGVATVDDAHATYWNPGALAFADGWSVMLPFSVQASSEGDAIETLDFVMGIGKATRPIVKKIKKGKKLTRDEVNTLLGLMRGIANIDPDGEGLLVDGELGFRGNAGRMGLVGSALTYTAVQPSKDTIRLQLSVDPSGPDQQVFNVVRDGADHSQGSAKPFAQEGSQGLADAIASKNTAWSQDQAEDLVFRAEGVGFDTDRREHRQFLKRSAKETGSISVAGQTIDLNDTGAFVRGIIATEIGVGYGRAFEIPHVPGKVAFGVVPKVIVGTTYFDFIRWDEVRTFADAVERLLEGPTVRTSANFGLDLGFMAKPIDRLTLGVTARNVNKPSFQFAGNGRYTIDPQVRTGIAYGITESWLVAFDADLTKNSTETITRFESRQVAMGTEYRLPFESIEVALRAGAWSNVAPKSNDAWALTTGFTIRKGGFAFDFAGGSSFETSEVHDITMPERMNFALNLRYEKKF